MGNCFGVTLHQCIKISPIKILGPIYGILKYILFLILGHSFNLYLFSFSASFLVWINNSNYKDGSPWLFPSFFHRLLLEKGLIFSASVSLSRWWKYLRSLSRTSCRALRFNDYPVLLRFEITVTAWELFVICNCT